MRRRNVYEPEPVEPRKPYDEDELVELAEVARICRRSLAWVEARTSVLPGVHTRSTDRYQWIRRGDIPEWTRAAEAEDYQQRAEPQPPGQGPLGHVGAGYTRIISWES